MCSNNGVCVESICVCFEGYGGISCSDSICDNDCSGKGDCIDGVCQCYPGYDGTSCEHIECRHGIWADDHCICDANYKGVTCDIPLIETKQLVNII